MKLMNFRRFDPAFQAAGKTGLSRGNKEEEVIWNEFAHDRSRLKAVADAIRNAVEAGGGPALDDTEGASIALEGRLLTRLHLVRERDRGLVEKRKASALKKHGRLVCEVCGFDFAERYGSRGAGFIECHHVRPVHTLAATGEQTSEDDLALVCANCHRMIHASQPWLTTGELRQQIRFEGR